MKRITAVTIAACAALSFLASCAKDAMRPDGDWQLATVTLRPQADGSFYIRQDDSTALVVSNSDLQKYPFGSDGEKRALVQFVIDDNAPTPSGMDLTEYKYRYSITLSSIDTIFTKDPVPSTGSDEVFGNDALGLYLSDSGFFPYTVIEDGYLNVGFNIDWAIPQLKHSINLVTGTNPDDPYEVHLRHDAGADSSSGVRRDCLVAFPLRSLPDTHGKTVKLTLKWLSSVTGEIESAEFDYRTRTDW